MTITRETLPGKRVPVTADVVVGGVRIPFSALDHMADDQLQAYGLEREGEPEPGAVPDISRRQFYTQLSLDGTITGTEALAAMTGELPAVIIGLISQLPDEQQFTAEMHLIGTPTFERDHPITALFGALRNQTPAETDEFFRAAATL